MPLYFYEPLFIVLIFRRQKDCSQITQHTDNETTKYCELLHYILLQKKEI